MAEKRSRTRASTGARFIQLCKMLGTTAGRYDLDQGRGLLRNRTQSRRRAPEIDRDQPDRRRIPRLGRPLYARPRDPRSAGIRTQDQSAYRYRIQGFYDHRQHRRPGQRPRRRPRRAEIQDTESVLFYSLMGSGPVKARSLAKLYALRVGGITSERFFVAIYEFRKAARA